jgi:hypothetical protein
VIALAEMPNSTAFAYWLVRLFARAGNETAGSKKGRIPLRVRPFYILWILAINRQATL